jgi:outer membrane protein
MQMPDARFEQDVGKLIEEARKQRPELAAAAAQVNAAKAAVDAARASGMPTISLATSVNRVNSTLSDTTNGSVLGVSINFPLFTGYNTTYRIQAAQEQMEARLAQQARLNQQVALDVWKAYQAVVTETQAVKSSADLLASASESERIALGRYKAGVGNFLEVLTAQTALASARLQNIQAVFNWFLAKVSLAQAMGKLDFSTIASASLASTSP